VADLLDGLARYLDGLGLLTYDPVGAAGDTFCDVMPDAPDTAVALTAYGGGEVDSKIPYDPPNVQVRTRGPATDRSVARTRAWALYGELHGLGPITLPDGTRLLSCIAAQTPASLGQDERGRLDYVFNLGIELYAPSVHRPG
jgi:hypothetical protein